jgi:integrase/recombinase XerD
MKIRGYSCATICSYRASLGVFLSHLKTVGITGVLEVTRATLRNYQLWLRQQDYAPWTVQARWQAVRRFFDHLEATQVILWNPCLGQEAPKVPCRLPKTVLTVDEARRLLEAPSPSTAAGIRDQAILEVFYSSGIRLAEMTRLTLADLDARNGFLRVNLGKCAKDRVVPLGRNACQSVLRYTERVRSQWSPPLRNQPALWLSSHPPHDPLKSQAIEVMVKRYGGLLGLTQHVTPHVWRHTCATHLVASGANIAYVQRLLGHSSLRTTQIYLHATIPEIKTTHAQAHPRNQNSALCSNTSNSSLRTSKSAITAPAPSPTTPIT